MTVLQRHRYPGKPLALILAAALVLRLFAFISIAPEPTKFYSDSDAYYYEKVALNLLRHSVYSTSTAPPYPQNIWRPPVYPALVALIYGLTGNAPEAMIGLQVLISVLTVLLTFSLACELHMTACQVAWLAALMMTVDPLTILMTNRLLSDTVFTALLMAGLWLLARYLRLSGRRWLILSAIALALASLTRAINQFLPLALLPVFFIAPLHLRIRQALVPGLLFALVSLALTNTWAYRNFRVAGLWTLSPGGEFSLLHNRAAIVLAAAEGLSLDEARGRLEQNMENTGEANPALAETVAMQRREALNIFARYPWITLKMQLKALAEFFIRPGYETTCILLSPSAPAPDCRLGFTGPADEPGPLEKALGRLSRMSLVAQLVSLWGTALLGIIYLGAAIGVIRLTRERRWPALALLLIPIIYFAALSSLGYVQSRYRLPMMPLLAILAGIGGITLRDFARAARDTWPFADKRRPTSTEDVASEE